MMYSFAVTILAMIAPSAAFNSNSRAGRKLLQNSRKLNDERDISWMPNYSIRFNKCHSLVQVANEENGGGEEGNILYTQHLTEYYLCPTDTCGESTKKCGKYITNTGEFAAMYIAYQEEILQAQCENIREYCNNDDENYCYQTAGMEECIEDENGQEDDMERYMECEEFEGNNNNGGNNNNNYNYNNNGNNYQYMNYFIGPQCNNNGKSLNIALYVDGGCSIEAEQGTYEKLTGGWTLPYSQESIIQDDCISCQVVDEDNNNNNNNNNNNGDVEVNELCEQAYEEAGRCEKKMEIQYPDTTACEFIDDLLPKMEGISRSILGGGSGRAALAFAWIFGIISVLLGFYSFLLYRRLKRSKVSLNAENPDGTLA